jgi:two-component system OmpR family sensor kinase
MTATSGPVPATRRPRPRIRGSRSLRARLLLALVALLAAVCAVVGWITVIVMQQFLVGRLDTQLSSAGGRRLGA